MRDILQGLAYIHNRRPYSLIHRDIKPTNILITNSKVAKITDFGLSKFYNLHKVHSFTNLSSLDSLFKQESNKEKTTQSNNENTSEPLIKKELTAHVGTERYMAPEANNSANYDNKIDIYSCGILFYEMFENKRYILNNGFNWYHTPKKIKDIILENMLCSDPKERLDAQSLIKRFDNI
jgi:serine/threonine protein kinase